MDGGTFWVWLAWHLPRTLVKWCAVRVMTYQYTGELSERTCLEALRVWRGVSPHGCAATAPREKLES